MKYSAILLFTLLFSVSGICQESHSEAPELSPAEPNCKEFHTGEFRYLEAHTNVVITRTKKYQIETDGDRKLKLKIKWLSDCEYTLTLVEANKEEDKKNIGTTMYNEIILINGSKVTVSTRGGSGKITTKMEKIR